MSDESAPWLEPGWQAEAGAWVSARLEQDGIRLHGLLETVHVRPWSTILRVHTDAGAFYFKAVAPMLAHEPALTLAIARRQPQCVPSILAGDLERGWLLMADGGERLRDILRATRDGRHWLRVLPIYAQLQITLAGDRALLLAEGALDRRLGMLPQYYEQLLADGELLRVDRPQGLSGDEYRRLHRLVSRVRELCAELAALPVAESLHHEDFHDANILVCGDRYTFVDWGECSVAHPFFSLRTVLISAEMTLGWSEQSSESLRLRDAYLDAWTHVAPRPVLLSALRLAQPLAAVARALTYQRVISFMLKSRQAEYAEAIPSLLREFLGAVAG